MPPIVVEASFQSLPIKTRQIILILLVIIAAAIVGALLAYFAAKVINLYREHKRRQALRKKVLNIEARMVAKEEGRKSIQRATLVVPSFPPMAHVAPSERQIQPPVVTRCSAEFSDPILTMTTSHALPFGDYCRPTPRPSKGAFGQGGLPVNAVNAFSSPESIHLSVYFSSKTPSTQSIPSHAHIPASRTTTQIINPVSPRFICAPTTKAGCVRDRYPIFGSLSDRGAIAISSGKQRLATAAEGEVVMPITVRECNVPGSLSALSGSVTKDRNRAHDTLNPGGWTQSTQC